MKKLMDSAIFLAVVTAFFYCISTAYYQGYLGTMQLDSDLLDRNLHQVLYQGFLVSLTPLILTLFIVTAIAFFFSHVIAPIWVSILKRSIKNKRRLFKAKKLLFGKYKDSPFEKRVKAISRNCASCFLVVSLSLLYLAYIESLGKEHAKDIQVEIQKGNYNKSNLVRLSGSTPKDLYLLACGARNCAGVDLQTKRVYYFESKHLSFVSERI
ncbi:hypothetical protein H4F05_00510 [Vibrio cholerae]